VHSAGAGEAGLNTVSGRVSAMEYQGSWLKITLEEACGEEFVVNRTDSIFFADPLEPGDPVLAQWQPEEVHFLAAAGQTGTARSAGGAAQQRAAAETH